ncbi:flagellar M-ring protein FliF [Helicobacter enhydrae]|uniref:Flagellar M-ring protein n=1 Tax=Helicobacter enhydrae TaxID=222136 RepID=A0A1B1U3M2_9HELI|nr:flagellar basal-body MS-ring/collar protein FliF [Helicobacter enhydrae]ANV97363.1 flagellar M-ring protein FliF [Helicobacter enhydrae]
MDIGGLFKQITGFYEKMNKKQKIVLLSSVVVVVGFLAYLIVFSTSRGGNPTSGYSVLFEKVDPKDSALIVEYLQQNQIPYQLPQEDKILVPTDQVYEQRIALASKGIPKNSKVGFEIFDTKNFGDTDFDQKVKFIRAIEGELSRTIESLVPIESASVHIALPKESVFVSKATPPTASVVVKIKENMVLSPTQVLGIKNLVAAAVTNLTPENVKIVDDNGETLGENTEENASRELSKIIAMQLKYKTNYEKALEEKIIKILAPIVGGQDRVEAKVTAEFDFRQTKSTQEVFDPNNVVRSEQSLEEKREGSKPKEVGGVPGVVSNIGPVQGLNDAGREKYEKSTNTTNYEVGKTVSEIKGEFGVLKRLSAAVVVDGSYEKVEENGVEKLKYVPITPENLSKIDALVKQAVGFSKSRGDEISVSNFELNGMSKAYKPKDKWELFVSDLKKYVDPFTPIVKYLIVVLIAFVFYKKVIAPFIERMLSVSNEEDDILQSMLDDEDVKEGDSRLSEMRKRVEEQLSGESLFNEEDVKYDVLVEKMRDLISEKPQEIAALFQKLITDELDIDGNKNEPKPTEM